MVKIDRYEYLKQQTEINKIKASYLNNAETSLSSEAQTTFVPPSELRKANNNNNNELFLTKKTQKENTNIGKVEGQIFDKLLTLTDTEVAGEIITTLKENMSDDDFKTLNDIFNGMVHDAKKKYSKGVRKDTIVQYFINYVKDYNNKLISTDEKNKTNKQAIDERTAKSNATRAKNKKEKQDKIDADKLEIANKNVEVEQLKTQNDIELTNINDKEDEIKLLKNSEEYKNNELKIEKVFKKFNVDASTQQVYSKKANKYNDSQTKKLSNFMQKHKDYQDEIKEKEKELKILQTNQNKDLKKLKEKTTKVNVVGSGVKSRKYKKPLVMLKGSGNIEQNQQRYIDIRNLHYIDLKELNNNILCLRYHKFRQINKKFGKQLITDIVKKLLIQLLKFNRFDYDIYNKLKDADKQIVYQFINYAHKNIDLEPIEEEETNRIFNTLYGEYQNGNHNKDIIKKLKNMLLDGIENGQIPQEAGMKLLREL